MVKIMDKPPLSIRRELDVIVLQEVRASSRPYIGLHVPQELQDKPRTLFFRSLQTRHRPSKTLAESGHCSAKELFWTAAGEGLSFWQRVFRKWSPFSLRPQIRRWEHRRNHLETKRLRKKQ